MIALPHRRSYDPPDGSIAARWNEKLKPWLGLIAAGSVIYGILATVMLSLGFRFSTPVQGVDAFRTDVTSRLESLTERVAALEEQDRESKLQRDRTEQWTIALIRSKCLELADNAEARALSVLPCEQFFSQWPVSRRGVPPLAHPGQAVSTAGAAAAAPPREE